MPSPETPTGLPEADAVQPNPPFWSTGFAKYGIGALLAWAICVMRGGLMFSDQFSKILELGAFMGLILFIFLGPIHFALQYVIHCLISWFWPSRKPMEGIIVNLPAFACLGYLLLSATLPLSESRLQSTFQAHFRRALPGSIHVKGFHYDRGMDFGAHRFLIEIAPNDLDWILTNSGCSLTNVTDSTIDPTVILKAARFHLAPPYMIYEGDTNDGTRRESTFILVGSNGTNLVFSRFY